MIAVPGATPKSPIMMLGPVLVTVEAAQYCKALGSAKCRRHLSKRRVEWSCEA